MGKRKTLQCVEFTPRADAALLRAVAELRPQQAREGAKLNKWYAVAKRVAREVMSETGGDVSTFGCMNRYKALLAMARTQPKGTWPKDEELHKLLQEALVEDASNENSTPLPRATVTPPQETDTIQPATEKPAAASNHKKKSTKDAESGASSSKKRKRRHHSEKGDEKAADQTPSKASRSSPKPLVLRLRRASAPGEESDALQWRFVEPEAKKPSRRHSIDARKSPSKHAIAETLAVAQETGETMQTPVVQKATSDVQPVPERQVPQAPRKARPTAAVKNSSKQRPAPQSKPTSRSRPAPVSVSPYSVASAPSSAVGSNAKTPAARDGPASPRHVFGDTTLVGELGQAVELERMWLNMAREAQASGPNEVEADADQRVDGTPTDDSSHREIHELKQMVKSMASALAKSQKEQVELRKLVTSSQASPTPGTGQLQLVQQIQQLSGMLSQVNQAHLERSALHQAFMGLQQQAAQLKLSKLALQREVACLWTELTALKGTQVLHTHAFEDVAKERSAIQASIEEAERRQQQFSENEKLKRQELLTEIEKGRTKQKRNAQELEESMVWFQDEMKRELDGLRDTVERDVAVFDDLLDSVQEEHKAQLEALNAKVSAMTESKKYRTSTQAPGVSEELQELREELSQERSDRRHEYEELLRNIQRIMANE